MNTTTASGRAMTRRQVIGTIGVAGLLGPAALHPAIAAHQDATDPLAGTRIEQLGGGVSTVAPDRALVLLQATMEPGTIIPAHSHPGPVALYVLEGTFGTEFVEGVGTVQPQPMAGTPVPSLEMAPGDDVQMPAGDALFYDGATHTMRNDGEEPFVLLVSALFDPAAPGFIWHEDHHGTPDS